MYDLAIYNIYACVYYTYTPPTSTPICRCDVPAPAAYSLLHGRISGRGLPFPYTQLLGGTCICVWVYIQVYTILVYTVYTYVHVYTHIVICCILQHSRVLYSICHIVYYIYYIYITLRMQYYY